MSGADGLHRIVRKILQSNAHGPPDANHHGVGKSTTERQEEMVSFDGCYFSRIG